MERQYLIGDVMSQNVLTTQPHELIVTSAQLMAEKKVGCLIVLEEGNVVGVLTEQDLARKVVAKGLDSTKTTVLDVMSKEVISIDSGKKLSEAVSLMGTNEIKHLPVIDEGKLMGIITSKDIVAVEPVLIEMLKINSTTHREETTL